MSGGLLCRKVLDPAITMYPGDTIEITLKASKGKWEILVGEKMSECPKCGGTGKIDEAGTDMISECFVCKGQGTVPHPALKSHYWAQCPACKGTGEAQSCEYCGEVTGEYPVILTYGDNEANKRQTKVFCDLGCVWDWLLAG